MNFTPEERERLRQKLNKPPKSTLIQLAIILDCDSVKKSSTPQVESKHITFTDKERENIILERGDVDCVSPALSEQGKIAI